LTPPVRTAVVTSAVGYSVLTTPFGFDRPDLGVVCGSGDVDIGYFFTGRRVVRGAVVRGIIGEPALASPSGIDGVDLVVISVVTRIGYPFAAGTVGRIPIICTLGGECAPVTSVRFDGVDRQIGSVSSCIGYLAGFARVVSLCRLGVKKHNQSHSRQQPRRCYRQDHCSEVVEPNRLQYISPFRRGGKGELVSWSSIIRAPAR
jgi:hypothetical protein